MIMTLLSTGNHIQAPHTIAVGRRCRLFLFLFVLCLCTSLGHSLLPGSNLFGIFRKRRRTLQAIQDKRHDAAAKHHFAGPHGEPLSANEALALAKSTSSSSGSSPLSKLSDWWGWRKRHQQQQQEEEDSKR